jgi:hypothetical protein
VADIRAALAALRERLAGGESQWCPGVGMQVSTSATNEDGVTWCPFEHEAPTEAGPGYRIIGEHTA